MNIEPEKHYITRDGRRARVYAMDGADPYTIHGAILFNEGWRSGTWNAKGQAVHKIESGADLIGPWIDKPEWPLWPVLPWFNWMAMDEEGQWYLYTDKPEPSSTPWLRWQTSSGCIDIPPEYAPKWTGDWRNSLVQRP